MTLQHLETLLARIAGRRVLCVGDLILDRFVYGATGRVSREAPVVVLEERRRETMLGAGGNVARNVAALGGRPILAGVIGDDPEGHEVSGLLNRGDIEPDLVIVSGRETATKTRFVAAGQQMLCVDRDPRAPVPAEGAERLIAAAASALSAVDLVILSDYGRGAITPQVSRAVIAAARAAQKPVVVDPRGRDFTRYDGASVLKPNAQELALEAGLPCGTDAEVAAALQAVMARLSGVEMLLVTRGPGGIALLPRDGEVSFHRARPRDVYDVSGAGDTTIAALALALAAGADIAEAISLANRTAGIAVGKIGTAVVSPGEVIADLRAETAAREGVVDLPAAARRAEAWRAAGLRVGLTNGVFDILHVGHLSSLETAKAACDRLIVGVNADASVRRLKGPSRPVNSEADRAGLLAGLASVDLVVVFPEDTATTLIEAIRPDVYVKGGDYTPETLPEAAAVRAYGGELRFAPLTPGRSTTAILARAAGEG